MLILGRQDAHACIHQRCHTVTLRLSLSLSLSFSWLVYLVPYTNGYNCSAWQYCKSISQMRQVPRQPDSVRWAVCQVVEKGRELRRCQRRTGLVIVREQRFVFLPDACAKWICNSIMTRKPHVLRYSGQSHVSGCTFRAGRLLQASHDQFIIVIIAFLMTKKCSAFCMILTDRPLMNVYASACSFVVALSVSPGSVALSKSDYFASFACLLACLVSG